MAIAKVRLITSPSKSKNIFLLLAYCLPLTLFLYQYLVNDFSADILLDYKDNFLHLKHTHPILFSVVFICCYSGLVAASISISAVLNVLAGYLFGPIAGALLASAGVVSGSYFLFLFSRYTARGLRVSLPENQSMPIELKNNFLLLFFMRLSPLVPSTLITVGSAVIRLKDRTFLSATFLGSFPLLLVYAMIGKQLSNIHHMEEIYDSSLGYLLLLFTVITFVPLLKPELREQLQLTKKDIFLPGLCSGKNSLSKQHADKRAAIRIPSKKFAELLMMNNDSLKIKVISKTQGVDQNSALLDISRMGMGIRLAGHQLQEKDEIILETRFAKKQFSISAIVRWIQEDRMGVEYIGSHSEGCAFCESLSTLMAS